MAPAVVVRDLFLRALGAIALIAFGSLQGQARLLFGSDGLAPACAATARSTAAWWQEPSLFAWQCSDRWLELGALAGMLASVLLIFHVLPRLCLLAIWLLYLSFVTVGSPFLDFQWDNLLLETCFFSWWIAPWRGGSAVPPSAPALFLMRWLLFRLHFESGIAKLASGDPTWRDLTAMVSYYETAPLPTWIGWYAHQMPEWLHRLSSAATFAVELLVPFLFWGPFALRRAAFVLAIGFHLFVLLTANYTIFNYLSIALCLFLLAPIWPERGNHSGGRSALARWAGRAGAVILIGLSTLPFLGMLGQAPRLALPLMQQLAPLRTFNAYHLFASMTLIRREAVVEGSDDGLTWSAYELHYKPGDPLRPPRFVAPHQPRVDFQMWFLLLGRRGAPYFDRLLFALLERPQTVAPLFAHNPFPDRPPKMLRVAIYRYQFSRRDERETTGAWWVRNLESYSRTLTHPDTR